MIKFDFLRSFMLLASFVASIVFCSVPFYAFLFILWFILLSSLSVFLSPVINFVYSFVVFFSLLHGWWGLSHVLEDYTFNLLLRPFFVSFVNIILLRVFVIYCF